ncbi:uncharacterized protein [Venturia canescens]|uniref:uncharacterized protein n=1 Tax=Venturia canescens TaxID=32260 RepID=UPI001C9D3D24|nr:uncharacterized protein LOC122412013 [Venturia canescens]
MELAGIRNVVSRRLREWLRETPGFRRPTIDKSSGTQAFERIPKPANIYKSENNYRDEHYKHHEAARENKRKKSRVCNYRRSQKNHHVYHVYKQNDSEAQSYVGRKNFENPLLSMDEFLPRNPVLVVPRIQPKNREEIFHLRNSKTTDENQLIKRYCENGRDWQANNRQRNSSLFRRQMSNLKNNANEELRRLEKLRLLQPNISCEAIALSLRLDFKPEQIQVEEQYRKKASQVFASNHQIDGKIRNFVNDKKNNENQELRRKYADKMKDAGDERIRGMGETKLDEIDEENRPRPDRGAGKVEGESQETLNKKNRSAVIGVKELDELGEEIVHREQRMIDVELKANDEIEENTKKQFSRRENFGEENTKVNRSENLPVVSSLTQNKMNDLLNGLRERINTLKHEEKMIGEFGWKMRQVRLAAESCDKFRPSLGHSQDKTSSLANYTIPICPGARASFAERIQEIWIDHRARPTPSGNDLEIFTEREKNALGTEVEKEPEEKFRRIGVWETRKAKPRQRLTKSILTATGRNFEIFEPAICHVGVQYEVSEFGARAKSLFSDRNSEEKRQSSIGIQSSWFPEVPRTLSRSVLEEVGPESGARKARDSVSSFPFRIASRVRRFGPLHWSRKESKISVAKLRMKFVPNLRSSVFRISRKIGEKSGGLGARVWFSMREKLRSKVGEKKWKFDENLARKSKRYENLASQLKNIFPCTKKKGSTKASENPGKTGGEAAPRLSPKSGGEKVEKKWSRERLDRADFSASPQLDEPFSKTKCSEKTDSANQSGGSMTKLSVTTSNSTNITRQLRGSTSDTRAEPSDELRLDSAPCQSRAEIIKTDCGSELERNCEEEKSWIIFEQTEPPSWIVDARKKRVESSSQIVAKLSPKRSIDKWKKSVPVPRAKREGAEKKRRVSRKTDFDARNETLAKGVISKMSSARSEKNLRLQRRKSVIDMKADKPVSSEQTGKVDVPSGRTQRSKYSTRQNYPVGKNETEGDGKRMGTAPSSSQRPKRRFDSSRIPREAHKSRGRSSLIPIPVGNARDFGGKKKFECDKNSLNFPAAPSLVDILDDAPRIKMEKSVNRDEKLDGLEGEGNFLSPDAKRSRTILKSTRPIPRGREFKKTPENKVHFELRKKFPNNSTSRKMLEDESISWKKKWSGLSGEIEDWKIEEKIHSSLETGAPLKTITITEPSAVARKSDSRFFTFEPNHFFDLPGDKSALDVKNLKKGKLTSRSCHKEAPPERRNPTRTLEKRDSNKVRLCHGALEKKQFYDSNEKGKEFRDFSSFNRVEKSERSLIVDLTSIKEKLDNEIIERTSRTSGTEDNDCAIILINAINSSMQLSDD